MISALILCRTDSSRLKNKHFFKIGNKTLIEIIIEKLSRIKLIDEIYIASGPKKKNFKFLELKKKKIKLNFFFHNNEKNVTKRIFSLSKKIKNKYTLIISGDCPIIDEELINLMYSNLIKKQFYEVFKFSKKVFYEGINLVKTSTWQKIYLLSKHNKIYQEHFSKIFDNKNSKLNIKIVSPPKRYIKSKSSKLRLSIDTLSDLNFFQNIYLKLKKGEDLNLINIKKYNYLSKINEHVAQRKPGRNYLKKIKILTVINEQFGYGHFKRCLTIKRQIEETISTNISFVYLNLKDIHKFFKRKYNFKKFTGNKDDLIIIDLPNSLINKCEKKLKNIMYKKLICIDKEINLPNSLNIIPFIKRKVENKKTLIGKKFLILDHDLIRFNYIKPKIDNKVIVLNGGSQFPDLKLLKYLMLKKANVEFIFGPLVASRIINSFRKKTGFKALINPSNYYSILHNSKIVICRYGVSVFECVFLGIKPYVVTFGESEDRLKDILILKQKGYLNIFDPNKNLKNTRKKFNFKKLKFGAKYLNKFL